MHARQKLITLMIRTVALGLVLLLPACRGAGDPEPGPATPDPANPEPLALVLEHVELAQADNREILTGDKSNPDEKTAEAAVEAARAALERYINAAFVDADSRFTAAPARSLVGESIYNGLADDQRQALAAYADTVAANVAGVISKSAVGRATVLFENGRAYAVAIEYRVDVELHGYAADPSASPAASPDATDAASPGNSGHAFSQQGSVIFTGPDWVVSSFDLRTDGPDVASWTPPPSPQASADSSANAVAS